SFVYADKPQTLDHLEDNIRRVIADIRPQMLEKVIENWTSRLDYIQASRGSLMPEIMFKMARHSVILCFHNVALDTNQLLISATDPFTDSEDPQGNHWSRSPTRLCFCIIVTVRREICIIVFLVTPTAKQIEEINMFPFQFR
ncbi:hypothetical protein TNCV_3960491, partial [Trichonephila clavipes]